MPELSGQLNGSGNGNHAVTGSGSGNGAGNGNGNGNGNHAVNGNGSHAVNGNGNGNGNGSHAVNGNGNGNGRSRVPLLSQVVLRTQSDLRLMQLASTGNEAAIDVLLQRYRKPLLQYCSRLVDPGRAEDIVQQTFEKAIAQLRGDNRILHIKPWLYRVVHNDAIDVMRQTARLHPLDEYCESRIGSPEQLEGRQQLRTAIKEIDNLPPRQRAALLLREMEGRSFEEIAAELDSSVEGVYQLLRRARQQLRDKAAALMPLSMVRWLSTVGSQGTAERAGEVAVGAGGAAGMAKLGAIALTVSAIAVGAANIGGSDSNLGRAGAGASAPQVAPVATGTGGATPVDNGSQHGSRQPGGALVPAIEHPGDSGGAAPVGGQPEPGDKQDGDSDGGSAGGTGSVSKPGKGDTGAVGAQVAATASAFLDGNDLHLAFETSSGSWSVIGSDRSYVVRNDQGAPLSAGPGCTAVSASELSCPVAADDPRQDIHLYGTEAADNINVGYQSSAATDTINVATSFSGIVGYGGLIEVHGGPGDDHLHSEPVARLEGQAGDDVLSVGSGAHFNVLRGGAGDDRLRGDDGNDMLAGDSGDDLLEGGDGQDVITVGDSGNQTTSGGGVDTIIAGDGAPDSIHCGRNVGTLQSYDPGTDVLFGDCTL